MTQQTSHRDQVLECFKQFIGPHTIDKMQVFLLDAGARNLELKPTFNSMNYQYIAIDFKPDEPGVRAMDFNQLQFPDMRFDVVFCCHAFEHTENPVRTLREFWRVLKRGGKLFMATPNCVRRQILEEDVDHICVLNEMQIERLLKYTGFKTKMVKLMDNYPGLEDFQWSIITVAEK